MSGAVISVPLCILYHISVPMSSALHTPVTAWYPTRTRVQTHVIALRTCALGKYPTRVHGATQPLKVPFCVCPCVQENMCAHVWAPAHTDLRKERAMLAYVRDRARGGVRACLRGGCVRVRGGVLGKEKPARR